MIDEATIAQALMKTPEWVILEGNPNSLCYHKVETKSDLVNLVQYLTLVTSKEADEWIKGSFPPNIVNKVVFQSNGQFYYLEAKANFNIPGDYYSINVDLYRYLDNNTDALPPVMVWEEARNSIGVPYPFDDLLESLEKELEEEHPSLSDIPDNAQHSLRLKRPEDLEQQIPYYVHSNL